jgi:hypothetical protein
MLAQHEPFEDVDLSGIDDEHSRAGAKSTRRRARSWNRLDTNRQRSDVALE